MRAHHSPSNSQSVAVAESPVLIAGRRRRRMHGNDPGAVKKAGSPDVMRSWNRHDRLEDPGKRPAPNRKASGPDAVSAASHSNHGAHPSIDTPLFPLPWKSHPSLGYAPSLPPGNAVEEMFQKVNCTVTFGTTSDRQPRCDSIAPRRSGVLLAVAKPAHCRPDTVPETHCNE